MPLIGYGAFVPAALGFLFLGLVTWNLVDTRLRSYGGFALGAFGLLLLTGAIWNIVLIATGLGRHP